MEKYIAARYEEEVHAPAKRALRTRSHKALRPDRRVKFFDFKGLMAPVFTAFKNDEEQTLNVEYIDRYAEWLKNNRISGILVNSMSGEGPALGLSERMQNAEAWWEAAQKYELVMFLQVGGAPLPDVLVMADHAQELGVHAVLCLPELFYKPTTVEQLCSYMRLVARRCVALPFFYYHLPLSTGVYSMWQRSYALTFQLNNMKFRIFVVNMRDFCKLAEESIPNFYGIHFAGNDLDDGEACLREGRVIMLGNSRLLACGLLVGFESALMTVLNIRPDLGWAIWNAMLNNNLETARDTQLLLNNKISYYVGRSYEHGYIAAMKNWFDDEVRQGNGPGFYIGSARKFF